MRKFAALNHGDQLIHRHEMDLNIFSVIQTLPGHFFDIRAEAMQCWSAVPEFG
jgi:hypothetical protein